MNNHNPITTMNSIEIEISNKAFNVAYQLQSVAAQIASLSAEAGRVQMACREYANGDLVPDGYNIDPIPNTPFFVVYRPNEDGEIHGIYCRGVEVTDYVTWTVGEDAQQIVIQAFDDEKTANEEWSAEQRFEAQRLGE
jgi:hypothetical protein